MSDATTRVLQGVAVSSGIAVGKAVVMEIRPFAATRIPLEAESVEREVARFRHALHEARAEIRGLRSSVARELGEEYARIFDAHDLIAADPELVEGVLRRIRNERVNSEWALAETVSELLRRFAHFEDQYLRERQEDLADVGRQIEKKLVGDERRQLAELKAGVILVAQEISPSDVIRFDRSKVIGFATEAGGRTSHAVIIAKSLGIPAVIGVPGLCAAIVDNDQLIVDGDAGQVILHPTTSTLDEMAERRADRERRLSILLGNRGLEAVTLDGHPIRLRANLEVPEELPDVEKYGARGIGLYRSEFLYIQKSPRLPTEDEHLALYRSLARAVAPELAVVRTFDLGGKKLAREVLDLEEDNPALGLRGVRLCLQRIDMFKTQLRALLRAGVEGNLAIMFPLVSSVEEVRQLRALLAELADELDRAGIERGRKIPVGVMIEVPSAAVTADLIAPEVDFFSIGTNDLIQYTVAIDRANESVNYLYQPLHPAILRLIDATARAAQANGIRVAMCGEMASDPTLIPLLLGFGVHELSMNPVAIPQAKNRIRETDLVAARALARTALELKTAAEVAELVGRRDPGRIANAVVEGRRA